MSLCAPIWTLVATLDSFLSNHNHRNFQPLSSASASITKNLFTPLLPDVCTPERSTCPARRARPRAPCSSGPGPGVGESLRRRSAGSLLYEPEPELLVGAPVSGVSVNRNTRIEMRLMCVCEEEGRERTAPARRLPGARRTSGRRTCARKERLLTERLRLARARCEHIHAVALKEVEVGFDCVHRRRVGPEGNGSSE